MEMLFWTIKIRFFFFDSDEENADSLWVRESIQDQLTLETCLIH